MLIALWILPVALAADQCLCHGIELITYVFEALLIRQPPVLLRILNSFSASDALLEE